MVWRKFFVKGVCIGTRDKKSVIARLCRGRRTAASTNPRSRLDTESTTKNLRQPGEREKQMISLATCYNKTPNRCVWCHFLPVLCNGSRVFVHVWTLICGPFSRFLLFPRNACRVRITGYRQKFWESEYIPKKLILLSVSAPDDTSSRKKSCFSAMTSLGDSTISRHHMYKQQ